MVNAIANLNSVEDLTHHLESFVFVLHLLCLNITESIKLNYSG